MGRVFKITYKSRLTLEQRRRVVIGYIIGFGHIGEPEIRAIIAQYTPNHVDFDFMRGLITIFIDGEVFDEDNMLNTLLRRIPAHLGLNITVHVRREYRQDLTLLQGGAATIHIHGDPAETRETITSMLLLSQSAASGPAFTSDTPTVAWTARTQYSLQQSGAIMADNDGGDTPPVHWGRFRHRSPHAERRIYGRERRGRHATSAAHLYGSSPYDTERRFYIGQRRGRYAPSTKNLHRRRYRGAQWLRWSAGDNRYTRNKAGLHGPRKGRRRLALLYAHQIQAH